MDLANHSPVRIRMVMRLVRHDQMFWNFLFEPLDDLDDQSRGPTSDVSVKGERIKELSFVHRLSRPQRVLCRSPNEAVGLPDAASLSRSGGVGMLHETRGQLVNDWQRYTPIYGAEV